MNTPKEAAAQAIAFARDAIRRYRRPAPAKADMLQVAQGYVVAADKSMADGDHESAWREAIHSIQFSLGTNGDAYASRPKPPNLRIPAGTYVLNKAIHNPETDRRERHNPWAKPIIPADSRVEVLDLTETMGFVALYIDNVYIGEKSPIAQAVIPYLDSAEEDFYSLKHKLTGGSSSMDRMAWSLLEQLCTEGTITKSDIEAANEKLLQRNNADTTSA